MVFRLGVPHLMISWIFWVYMLVLVFMCFFNIYNVVLQEGRGNGEWRRSHNEELNDLYSSPNIVWMIKSRRMRWAGHVARMGEEGGCIGSWGGETGRKKSTGET